MFELTPEQQRELGQTEPARALDPETNVEYVWVRADLYERMKAVFQAGGLDMRQVAVLVAQALREDDADDPLLESYEKYCVSS